MKKTLFIMAVLLIAVQSAFSSVWQLKQESVKDEFGDETGVNDYYIYGEKDGNYTDKYIWLYIDDGWLGYSFANGYIRFGGKGLKTEADSKSCTVRIKEDSGNVVEIRTKCSVHSNSYYWACSVKLDASDVKRMADVFARNKSPKLVVNVQGIDSYNWGVVECAGASFDPTCLKNGHRYSDGKCARCGADDPSDFKMVRIEGSAYAYAVPKGVSASSAPNTFYMAETEVTQALYKSVMGSNPSKFKGESRPVEKVSWYDAVEFCNRLSEMNGLEKCYSGSGESITCDFYKNGYRLPTEAEWEYAAKGGEKSKGYKYSGSDDIGQVAWYQDNSGDETHTVKTKNPNELGIYDMTGNVSEWCWDLYSSSSSNRVSRGGNYNFGGGHCSVSDRDNEAPSSAYVNYGFRLARSAWD